MARVKSVISFLLLMVYSTGLVQGATPRCNHYGAEVEVGEVHHHEHHEHADNEHVDHDHIVHNDHLDDGAFDLLLCVLEDVAHSEHPGDGCHCLPSISSRIGADWIGKMKLLAVVVPQLYETESTEQSNFYVLHSIGEIHSPFLKSSSQRGPPSIS